MQTLPVPVALTADSEHFRRQREKYRERERERDKGTEREALIPGLGSPGARLRVRTRMYMGMLLCGQRSSVAMSR